MGRLVGLLAVRCGVLIDPQGQGGGEADRASGARRGGLAGAAEAHVAQTERWLRALMPPVEGDDDANGD
ncbi:hypothetical protein [Streptomyces sp. KR55]|uniref:hypothetical protein n=1 Tax=Streptomyces sp. KR55 TaxID=3457425 RepID=UPI003FD1D37A